MTMLAWMLWKVQSFRVARAKDEFDKVFDIDEKVIAGLDPKHLDNYMIWLNAQRALKHASC